MTFNEIIEKMRRGIVTLHEAASLRTQLTGDYSSCSVEMGKILAIKPAVWNELRRNFKSDKATDRAWEASENGMKETQLKLKMKTLEKMISALKTVVDVANNEARNLY